MRLLVLMLFLALPLMSLPTQAQDEQDPYSLAIVRFEIRMRSGESSARHGFSQRQIVRFGDGISIALVKILDARQMLDPGTLDAILPMIREAFSRPDLISIEANKQPQVTLLLLNQIRQQVSDRRIDDQIDETIAFVKKSAN